MKTDTAVSTGALPDGRKVVSSEVLIAIVDRLSDPTATALILRRAKLLPHDVIVLRRANASGAELGAAMKALANARERSGEVSNQDVMIVSRGHTAPGNWKQDGSDALAQEYMSGLATAPEEDIPGVGRGRSMRIVMGRLKKR